MPLRFLISITPSSFPITWTSSREKKNPNRIIDRILIYDTLFATIVTNLLSKIVPIIILM